MARSAVMIGLKEMQKRLHSQDFMQAPAKQFLRDWREDVKEGALKYAPEWKGSILDSIQSSQDTKKFPLWARVYSDNKHARWADLGTGKLSDDPLSPKQPYFPSVTGITEWAVDHQFDPYALAVTIFRQGGTLGSHFFERAARDATGRMNERAARFAVGIERAGAHP